MNSHLRNNQAMSMASKELKDFYDDLYKLSDGKTKVAARNIATQQYVADCKLLCKLAVATGFDIDSVNAFPFPALARAKQNTRAGSRKATGIAVSSDDEATNQPGKPAPAPAPQKRQQKKRGLSAVPNSPAKNDILRKRGRKATLQPTKDKAAAPARKQPTRGKKGVESQKANQAPTVDKLSAAPDDIEIVPETEKGSDGLDNPKGTDGLDSPLGFKPKSPNDTASYTSSSGASGHTNMSSASTHFYNALAKAALDDKSHKTEMLHKEQIAKLEGAIELLKAKNELEMQQMRAKLEEKSNEASKYKALYEFADNTRKEWMGMVMDKYRPAADTDGPSAGASSNKYGHLHLHFCSAFSFACCVHCNTQ